MKFEDTHQLNKPAASVLKMYSDRGYFEKKYATLAGVKDFEILECETSGSRFRIKHRSQQKSDTSALPEFARKFLAEYNTVVQQDTWDLASGSGRLEIEIKGVPIKISADMKVSGAPNARNAFNWNVSCSIPLLGGKLEKFIVEDIKTKSAADAALSNQMLAAY